MTCQCEFFKTLHADVSQWRQTVVLCRDMRNQASIVDENVVHDRFQADRDKQTENCFVDKHLSQEQIQAYFARDCTHLGALAACS